MSVIHPTVVDDAVFGAALAAGTANIIMQLSRPGVGHGVVESPVDSGKATLHPIKRARTTFTYLAVALWGTDVERKVYRNAVNGSHAQVRSTDASPVEYNAFDPDLQLWVAACLYRGLEDVHRAMFPDSNFRGEHGIYEAWAAHSRSRPTAGRSTVTRSRGTGRRASSWCRSTTRSAATSPT